MRRYSMFFRKAGMTEEAFHAYYENPHGHMIASLPEFWKYTDRYIQNHVLPAVPNLTGGQPEWEGISELWQPADAPAGKAFFDERAYKDRVAPDEPNFITVKAKLRLSTEPRVVIDGAPSKVKILTLIRRKPGISVDAFRQAWAEHGERVKTIPPFQRYARRYVQHIVVPGSVGSESGHAGYDGIVEFWYDSIEDALTAYTSAAYFEALRTDEDRFVSDRVGRFLVREVWIPRSTP